MNKSVALNVVLSILTWQIVGATGSFSQSIHQVKATIAGLGDRSVQIQYTRQGMFLTDTVKASQSQFTHSMDSTDGRIATLVISPSLQLTFWLESPLILITGTLATLGSAKGLTCTGTPENNLFEVYRNTVENPYAIRKQGQSSAETDLIARQQQQATRQFIKQHPSSLTAAYLLYGQSIDDTTVFDQLDQLLASLSPSVKSSYWAQKAITRMYNFRNRPRVGKKLPAFSLPDACGQLISLDSFKGKYVLIDFWGTWCTPCIQGIPELKAVQIKYKDRLAVVSIALERPGDRAKWLRAIDKYGMTWPQTAQFTDRKEGVNGLYNVIEYPTLLVADPDGVLLAKIKYGEPIEEKIQPLLDR